LIYQNSSRVSSYDTWIFSSEIVHVRGVIASLETKDELDFGLKLNEYKNIDSITAYAKMGTFYLSMMNELILFGDSESDPINQASKFANKLDRAIKSRWSRLISLNYTQQVLTYSGKDYNQYPLCHVNCKTSCQMDPPSFGSLFRCFDCSRDVSGCDKDNQAFYQVLNGCNKGLYQLILTCQVG